MTVRHDLNELKLCMYQAISHYLDRHQLPPEKISVALAVAVDEYLDKGAGQDGDDPIRVERFMKELLRNMEKHTKGITATMKIAPDADIDVDAAEARMSDKEVEDWYIELTERGIPSGLVDYEDGDAARNPSPEALGVALAFAVTMCLKHDVPRVERFMQDLRAEHRRGEVYRAKYSPAWSLRPSGRA